MKAVLLLCAILAVTACLPVPQDQERVKRSVSDSDEILPRLPWPPQMNPLGPYPPLPNQDYMWKYYYCLLTFFPPGTPSPYQQNEKKATV